ncbi:MAG: hypothetical protein J6A54_06925 [Clostridia bacterium]|nr:hypothetical protein [Clostridia bacterium]
MKMMKALKIIHTVGYICLFVAVVFNFVNKIADKMIFNEWVLFPLMIIGLVGIVTGIIYLLKLAKPVLEAKPADEETESKDK